ncbi:hypothetical protein O987_10745 [Comamonas testosteroni TK102]|uniref:Uncharacterized protein n=1 Tax=Comamonas testosteroni TK102 TaxID=1392005 RepID=A0A076PRE7_COMTE|nr:hypothetical protein O987_10745 [Comamonas testosteroni TK102]
MNGLLGIDDGIMHIMLLMLVKQLQDLLHAFKAEKRPPTISKGVINQGTKALINNAAGTKMALFSSEPLATAQTTGSSRLAFTPVTCSALSARSSPSTPAVFCTATLVWVATSSRIAVLLPAAVLVIKATSSSKLAISSSNIKRPAPAIVSPGVCKIAIMPANRAKIATGNCQSAARSPRPWLCSDNERPYRTETL